MTRTPLKQVIEPLSLLVRAGGELVIGDGRDQQPAQPGISRPIWSRWTGAAPAQWTETLLLPTG